MAVNSFCRLVMKWCKMKWLSGGAAFTSVRKGCGSESAKEIKAMIFDRRAQVQ